MSRLLAILAFLAAGVGVELTPAAPCPLVSTRHTWVRRRKP
jgi:hypothetical protein